MKKYIPITLALTLVLSGCQGLSKKVDSTMEKKFGASAMTVEQIKKKYGTEENTGLMPMYNVAPDKEFTFNFPYKIGDVSPFDMITVHTDIKCLPESKVFAFVNQDYAIGTKDTNITVKPMTPVLQSEKDKKLGESLYGKGTWGNAPIYYIRINYDLYSPTLKKLEQPIIVPFTVQSDLPVPNLRHEISPDGQLKLVWDKVEGAEKYNVYQVAKYSLLETKNEETSGAETGYKGFPQLQATVTETEFSNFIDIGSTLNKVGDVITGENYGVEGDYYVTAVAGEKESNFSLSVATPKLSSQLPQDQVDDLYFHAPFENTNALPKQVAVKMIDGTIQQRDVVYEPAKAETKEFDGTTIPYTVKGTAFKGTVKIKAFAKDDQSKLEQQQKEQPTTGYVETKNETDSVPAPNVPTIITTDNQTSDASASPKKEEPKKDQPQKQKPSPSPAKEPKNQEPSSEKPKETSTEPSSTPEKSPSSTESKPKDDVVEQQKENTQEHVEQANQEKVEQPPVLKDVKLHADSALEEYLATQLMNAEGKISLEAFPEAQNSQTLADTLLKVKYQNPLILGMNTVEYDYRNLTLVVGYDDSADVIKKKQQEIIAEAKKIVSSVVKSGMSDEEKRKALYDYLNDKTKYDEEALKSAEKTNYQEVDPTFNDSFTTYGIMVKKVGVCMSYAYTYKMLLDLAGVESVVVTGALDGVPHAWNKVKIGNEWLNVDNTNNETNVGIPYMIYEMSDETAKKNDEIADKDYWLDSQLPQFKGTTNEYDYYVANKLEAKDLSAVKTQVEKFLKKGDKMIVVRLGQEFNQNELMTGVAEVFNRVAKDKLNGARGGMMGNYFVIQTE